MAVSGFVATWASGYNSTVHRVELRNVRQGGNDFLAALPLAGQAMWAGALFSTVSTVVMGPLKWIALFFRWVFHPLICGPLSILSCAVKERFYESSVTTTIREETKYYERGAEVPNAIKGTVTLMVDGQPRHFSLGGEITNTIEYSLEVERNGQMKRFPFRILRDGEPFDADCREIERNGVRIRVKLNTDWELDDSYKNFIQIEEGGRKKYFRLGIEVPQPVQGTITVRDGWEDHYFLVGNQIPAEAPGCIKVKNNNGVLHYETGRELDAPTETSRSFTIDGKLRHFASAKFVLDKTKGLSGWINDIPRIPFKLPTRLHRITVKALEFVNAHMSNIIRIAILVAGAVCIYFGSVGMAVGAFAAVAYEYLDHDLGVIPQKVSLFMEKWMPAITMMGLLIVGSFAIQIMSGITLLLMIPEVNKLFHQKISKVLRPTFLGASDQVLRWFARGERPPQVDELIEAAKEFPSLEQLDGPLCENRSLSKGQIDRILDARNEQYELSPSHLTKNFEPSLNLPENRNFNELLRLWDAQGDRLVQPNTYLRFVNRLLDDERFFIMLQQRFPEAKPFHFEENWRLTFVENRILHDQLRDAHREQIENWIQTLAQEKGYANKQTFIAAWIKQQLEFFVGKVSGNRPIEGEQRFLNDAIQYLAKIIPFLTNPATRRVELEDALLKLAIEGGDYCALAMKRAAHEVYDGFAEPLLLQQEPDPHKRFEMEVRLGLQRSRLTDIQGMYNEIVQIFSQKEELKKTGSDIHLYTALTRAGKRGIYPLEKEDMEQFSLTELILKDTVLLPVQIELLRKYKQEIPELMRGIGIDRLNIMRNRTLDYLRDWVQQNNTLSAAEREELLANLLSDAPDNVADADNYPKWDRLLLYILGVYKEKQMPAPAAVVAG